MSVQQRKRRRHPVLSFFKIFFLVLLAVAVIGGAGIFIYIHNAISRAPELDLQAVIPASASTYICDQEGKRLLKLTLPESNRDLVTIDRIPADLQHAFVAIEDSRFYRHRGVDPIGIVRALFRGLYSGSFNEGASTITQQLLKNSLFTGWTSEQTFDDRLNRKIQEQYLAVKLEQLMSKDEILENYLNVINLGAGCYGVQAASYRYFGKDVSELSLSECAVIAGITQNPARYNPITNPEDNARRRQAVLTRMLEQKYCTSDQYQEAIADNVYARIQKRETQTDASSSIYTYYQDALIDQVARDLITDKGYTEKQAYRAVYSGGLRIYSAQDMALQTICDNAFADDSLFPDGTLSGIDYALSIEQADGSVKHFGNDDLIRWMRTAVLADGTSLESCTDLLFPDSETARAAADAFRRDHVTDEDRILGERVTITPQPQAGLVLMDQTTGYVRALVGGRGTKEASLTLNRATYTTRQPGSTFKILSAYAPALDAAGMTLATTFDSSEYELDDGTHISNWDLQTDGGPVSMREAIVRSVNTAAVRCITQITPQLGFQYARAMGISTLTESREENGTVYTDVVPSLALGGLTDGATVLDLCSAYACIANGGKYVAPKFYTKVCASDGTLILDNTVPASRAVLKPSTAYLLTDAMTGVLTDPEGTAYGTIDLGDMAAAGKTGTTSSYRDLWFAGYTPYYTCCVWGGFDNNNVLPDEGKGHTYHKLLWNAVMREVHQDLPARAFERPADVMTMNICRETGMAASAACPSVREELFASGAQPALCSAHGSALDGAIAIEDAGSAAGAAANTGDGVVTTPGGAAFGEQSGELSGAADLTIASDDLHDEGAPAGQNAGGGSGQITGDNTQTAAGGQNTGGAQAGAGNGGQAAAGNENAASQGTVIGGDGNIIIYSTDETVLDPSAGASLPQADGNNAYSGAAGDGSFEGTGGNASSGDTAGTYVFDDSGWVTFG